jgi:integrase
MVKLDRDSLEFLEALDGNTRRVYRAGLTLFQEFYGKPPSRFLDEVEEDMSKPRRERRRVATNTLRMFVEWLEGKGYTPKSIRSYVASVQSLARYYEIPISMRYVRMPPSIPESKKFPWTLEKVGEFIGLLETLDVRALAACLFQSGLSLSDALSLTYGDVKHEYESGVVPLCFDLVRIKTDTPYMTFIGKYAFSLLDEYLKARGRLKPTDPLFKVSQRTVSYRFERAAEKMIGRFEGRNPCSPHSLRSAFRTLLRDAGAPEEYVEFWMGHNIGGDIRKIYTRHSRDGWREEYKKWEPYLTPEGHGGGWVKG